jgi:hypothetical protein
MSNMGSSRLEVNFFHQGWCFYQDARSCSNYWKHTWSMPTQKQNAGMNYEAAGWCLKYHKPAGNV